MSKRNKEQEELSKLSVELRLLEQTAETLQSRIGMINAAITDLTYADRTLDGIEEEKKGAELLVPIGGSSYITAKLANTDRVIIGIGAGVSVEKTLPEAKEIVKERLSELEKNMKSSQQQFEQVAERINAGRKRLERVLSTVREGKN